MTIAEIHAVIDARATSLHALADAAEKFNSGLTQIIGRDANESITFVAVFATDDDAVELAEFLALGDDEEGQ